MTESQGCRVRVTKPTRGQGETSTQVFGFKVSHPGHSTTLPPFIFSRSGFPLNRAFWLAGERSGFPHTDPAAASLGKQVLSKQVFSFIFSKNLAVTITLEWATKAFTANVSFIYILKSKTSLFVFFHSTRYITLSINFSYTAESRPAFFMNWKFLVILSGKNKYVIHRPGSVRIRKRFQDLGHSFSLPGPRGR